MKKEKKLTKLSPGEAELLEIFWEHGDLTLPKTYEIYQLGGKKVSYSTIQTRLNRMVEKKLLQRNSEFPAVYTANIAKSDARGKYFELLEELAGKNFVPLMLHLFEKKTLTSGEIDTMKSILAKIEKEKKDE